MGRDVGFVAAAPDAHTGLPQRLYTLNRSAAGAPPNLRSSDALLLRNSSIGQVQIDEAAERGSDYVPRGSNSARMTSDVFCSIDQLVNDSDAREQASLLLPCVESVRGRFTMLRSNKMIGVYRGSED